MCHPILGRVGLPGLVNSLQVREKKSLLCSYLSRAALNSLPSQWVGLSESDV